MTDIGELCSRVVTIADRETSLTEAAELMRAHHVGSLVIVDETSEGRIPVGMLTDRDIVVAVVAGHADPGTLNAGEVMTADPVTVREDASVFDALQLMRRRGVRRVPVVSAAGILVGIVTVDDLLEVVAEQLNDIVRAIASEQAHEARNRRASA